MNSYFRAELPVIHLAVKSQYMLYNLLHGILTYGLLLSLCLPLKAHLFILSQLQFVLRPKYSLLHTQKKCSSCMKYTVTQSENYKIVFKCLLCV